MTMLTYKEFRGSLEHEDGRWIVQILDIEDTVLDEVTDAAAAQEAFADLVEDYLETCHAAGKEPSRPYEGSHAMRPGR